MIATTRSSVDRMLSTSCTRYEQAESDDRDDRARERRRRPGRRSRASRRRSMPSRRGAPPIETASSQSSTPPQNTRVSTASTAGRMLPTRPKVARETIMVGWPLHLPARVPSPSGRNERATPATMATIVWRRLIPRPNSIAPTATHHERGVRGEPQPEHPGGATGALFERRRLERRLLDGEGLGVDERLGGRSCRLRRPRRRRRRARVRPRRLRNRRPGSERPGRRGRDRRCPRCRGRRPRPRRREPRTPEG